MEKELFILQKSSTGGVRYTECSNCKAKIKVENIPAFGHIPGEQVVVKEPTCDEGGAKHLECSLCQTTLESEEITALEHTSGNCIVDSEPTCDEGGSNRNKQALVVLSFSL